jgi:hypothetical protein
LRIGTLADPGQDAGLSWLKVLVTGFRVAYGMDAEIEVKKKEAAK